MKIVSYILILLIRIFAAVLIFAFPFPGWLISYISDFPDYLFAIRAGLTFKQYQYIDKTIDVWFRLCMMLYTVIANWEIKWLFIILFFYRLVGDLSFYFKRSEKFLFFFPNFVEFLFPAYLIYLHFFANHQQSSVILIVIIVFALILKLMNEYLLHVTNYVDPFSRNLIKKYPGHQRSIN